jgi:hypothetical protein
VSILNGEGFGDCHDWKRGETLPWKVTDYKCQDCGAYFRHCYDDIPDIFEAMEFCKVPAKCEPTIDIEGVK